MTCGCGKQRTQNVGRLWAHIDALEILQAEALEENERLRRGFNIAQDEWEDWIVDQLEGTSQYESVLASARKNRTALEKE